MPQKLIHRLIDKLVGDRLFGLVLIRSLGGKAARNQYQTILHIRKGDLAFPFVVLPGVFDVVVDHIDKRQLDRAFRGTAMLQKAGIVVILSLLHPVGKTTGHIQLDLVFRLVLPVAASALGLPKLHRGQRAFPRKFARIIDNPVFIEKLLLVKP